LDHEDQSSTGLGGSCGLFDCRNLRFFGGRLLGYRSCRLFSSRGSRFFDCGDRRGWLTGAQEQAGCQNNKEDELEGTILKHVILLYVNILFDRTT
jgi:hypothetical protein